MEQLPLEAPQDTAEDEEEILSFASLPLDVLNRILKVCTPKTITRLRLTCRELHHLISLCETERFLWRDKLQLQFGISDPLFPSLVDPHCLLSYRLCHGQQIIISGVGSGLVAPFGSALFSDDRKLQYHRNWLPRWVLEAPPIRYRTLCSDSCLPRDPRASDLLRCIQCIRKEIKSSEYLVRGLTQISVSTVDWSFMVAVAARTADGRMVGWCHGHPQFIPPGPLYPRQLPKEVRAKATCGRFAQPNSVKYVHVGKLLCYVVSTEGELWCSQQSDYRIGEQMTWLQEDLGGWEPPAPIKKVAVLDPVRSSNVLSNIVFLLLENGQLFVYGWCEVGEAFHGFSNAAVCSMFGLGSWGEVLAMHREDWTERRRVGNVEPWARVGGDGRLLEEEDEETMEELYISRPRRVLGALQDAHVVDLHCGSYHVACVLRDGGLVTWGQNTHLQTGHVLSSSTAPKHVPDRVAGLEGRTVVKAQCGHLHTVALTASGQVYVMGSLEYGALGDPSRQTPHPSTRHAVLKPQPLDLDPSFKIGRAVDISAGALLTVVTDETGRGIVLGGHVHEKGPRLLPLGQRVPVLVACAGLPDGVSAATNYKALDVMLVVSCGRSAAGLAKTPPEAHQLAEAEAEGEGRAAGKPGGSSEVSSSTSASKGEGVQRDGEGASASSHGGPGGPSGSSSREAVPSLPVRQALSYLELSALFSGLSVSPPPAEHRERSCRVCGAYPPKGTLKCSRCRAAFYCSSEHQRLDWPQHKGTCKPAPAVVPAPSSPGGDGGPSLRVQDGVRQASDLGVSGSGVVGSAGSEGVGGEQLAPASPALARSLGPWPED